MTNNFNPGFDREKAAFLELANRGDGLTPIGYLYAEEASFGSVLSPVITGGTAELYTIYASGINSSNITNSNDVITYSLKLSNQLNDYYVGFTAGSLNQSTIWSLPLQDGSNGQVLATDGSGSLSFIDVQGGGGGAPKDATYILQHSDSDLPNAQALNGLGTGIAKITGGGFVIIATPDVDYATVATLEEIANEAQVSADNAANSATDAANSADEAAASAAQIEVDVEEVNNAVTNAQTAATNAAASATNAASSASDAAASATDADNSKIAAIASATAAGASAAVAVAAATTAATSATAAAGSAAAAALSDIFAGASATAAEVASAAATASATAAAGSATAAGASATTAATAAADCFTLNIQSGQWSTQSQSYSQASQVYAQQSQVAYQSCQTAVVESKAAEVTSESAAATSTSQAAVAATSSATASGSAAIAKAAAASASAAAAAAASSASSIDKKVSAVDKDADRAENAADDASDSAGSASNSASNASNSASSAASSASEAESYLNTLLSTGLNDLPCSGDVSLNNYKLTDVAAPELPTDGINKEYINNIVKSIGFEIPCYGSTIENLNVIYNNGTLGVGATLTNAGLLAVFSIDGQTPPLTSRILVKDQIDATQNGIYTLTNAGDGLTIPWVLTRASDYDEILEIQVNNLVLVEYGTINAITTWVQTSNVTEIGISTINFSTFDYSPTSFLLANNNLADLDSIPTARENLGLTNIVTQSTSQYSVLVGNASDTITSIDPGIYGTVFSGVTEGNPTFTNNPKVTSLTGSLIVPNSSSIYLYNTVTTTLSLTTDVQYGQTFTALASGILKSIQTSFVGTFDETSVFKIQIYLGATISGTPIYDTDSDGGNISYTTTGSDTPIFILPTGIFLESGIEYTICFTFTTIGISGISWNVNNDGGVGTFNFLDQTPYISLTSSVGTFNYLGNDIAFSGPVSFLGNYPFVANLTDSTDITFPTSGTLITDEVSTLSNLSAIGTINTGIWNATPIDSSYIATTGVASGTYTYISSLATNAQGQITSISSGSTPTGGTVTSVGISTTSIGITLGGTNPITDSGTFTIDLNSELQGLASLNANGIIIRTGSGAYTPQAITQYDVLVGGSSNTITSIGTGTLGQVLQSGGNSANPTYSTATYPTTTIVNQLLYSSSTNTITGLATANNSILATNSSGVPSLTTTLPFTVPVTTGGTGLTSTTAYGVLCGGTTSTDNFQNTGTGTSGQVLTSNGSSALPSWQPPTTGTITSITAGTGLSGGTITTSGTIAIANTGVTAGTYVIPNLTVNAQGQIISIATGTAAPVSSRYIVQTSDLVLTNEQSLGNLSTGMLKNTTTSGVGVLSIATAGTDYYSPGNPTTILDNGSNLFIGSPAGLSSATGTYNLGIGPFCLVSLTTGNNNIALGNQSLIANTTGGNNCAIGQNTLRFNIGGDRNIAIGTNALTQNQSTNDNTAVGYVALAENTASNNSAFGSNSLSSNTTGTSNVAVGYNSLNSNTIGSSNTGIGRGALATITTTSNNTAVGANAADSTTGNNNTAIGQTALTTNISGSGNTALGTASGSIYNTYTNCLFLGYNADTSANSLTNAISIGYNSTVGVSNAMRLGNGCYIGINQGSPSYALHINNVNNVCALYMNTTTNTPSIPASGGLMYTSGGELYYKGNSKTVSLTTAGNPAPTNATYIVQTSNSTLTNEQALSSLSTGILKNTTGTGVLSIATAGADYYSPSNPTTILDNGNNFFIGTNAGNETLTAINNTGIGTYVLNALTSDGNCTGVGFNALKVNTGANNTAVGSGALDANTTGTQNTAVGKDALGANTTGIDNTAVGYYALNTNTTASSNTAIGKNSLRDNTTGTSNTAVGVSALVSNTIGNSNTAVGVSALILNITGANNTAIGLSSLANHTSGNNNTAIGVQSAFGYDGYVNCVFIGTNADTTSDNLTNAIAIGYNAQVSTSNSMVLGNGVNVGIGTSSPTHKLDVNGGNINAPSGLTPATQLLGRCMLSSANTFITAANASWTALAFNGTSQTTYDPSNWHSNTVNPDRITPGIIGTYRLTGALRLANSNNGEGCGIGFGLNTNSPTDDRTSWAQKQSATTDRRSVTNTCIIQTTSNSDYFRLMVHQDSGGTLGLLGFHFQVERLV